MTTGKELRAARKQAGLSQIALAKQAKIGRHAVSYWENKPHVDPRGWAPKRMAEILGAENLPDYWTYNARAREWGVSGNSPSELAERPYQAQMRRLAEAAVLRRARLRVLCGARTRKGVACRNMSEPGRRRCKFHGGKSTGAKTPEGLARIAEAQRKRWARRREAFAAQASASPLLPETDCL